MANNYFQFKRFLVRQDKCAMKVGTDGVLLGAWASLTDCRTVLDIGTGTGLIALMLAQRSDASVDAIDIDDEACRQATENVAGSPFAGRIRIYRQPFEEFIPGRTGKYDLLVSNPPYFNRSLKSPDSKRTAARHTDTLSFTDILDKGRSLLTLQGRIALIIPYEQQAELIHAAREYNLQIIRRTNVFPTPESNPKRILAELAADPSAPCMEDDLIIEEARHTYTAAYHLLTKDFYL